MSVATLASNSFFSVKNWFRSASNSFICYWYSSYIRWSSRLCFSFRSLSSSECRACSCFRDLSAFSKRDVRSRRNLVSSLIFSWFYCSSYAASSSFSSYSLLTNFEWLSACICKSSSRRFDLSCSVDRRLTASSCVACNSRYFCYHYCRPVFVPKSIAYTIWSWTRLFYLSRSRMSAICDSRCSIFYLRRAASTSFLWWSCSPPVPIRFAFLFKGRSKLLL